MKIVEWMLTVAGEQDPKLVDQQLAESFIDQVVDKTEMTSLTPFFKGSALKKIILKSAEWAKVHSATLKEQ